MVLADGVISVAVFERRVCVEIMRAGQPDPASVISSSYSMAEALWLHDECYDGKTVKAGTDSIAITAMGHEQWAAVVVSIRQHSITKSLSRMLRRLLRAVATEEKAKMFGGGGG